MKNPWKALSKVNPQRENGHREIANDVFQKLLIQRLTGAEWAICMSIIDQTYGFNRHWVDISYQTLANSTTYSRRMAIKAVKSLERRRLLVVNHSSPGVNHSSPVVQILFNKHYDTWQGGSEPQFTTGEPDGNKVVNHSSPGVVNHSSPFKRKNIKKEYKEKNIYVRQADEAIDYLNQKGNKKFTKSKRNRSFAITRLKEGLSLDDLKAAVDNKLQDTYFTIDSPHLFRPQTIFGPNCESYVNAARASPQSEFRAKYGDRARETARKIKDWKPPGVSD